MRAKLGVGDLTGFLCLRGDGLITAIGTWAKRGMFLKLSHSLAFSTIKSFTLLMIEPVLMSTDILFAKVKNKIQL